MTFAGVPRYRQNRVGSTGNRAIVLGASMAGLLAARVLSDAFEEVIVVERDAVPDEPEPRRGVPQGRHSHILMEAGRATFEDLFPGYGEDILSNGGLMIDGVSDVVHYERGGRLADGREQAPMYCASRPLFETTAQRRLSNREGVTLRSECQFTGYTTDETGGAIDGIEMRNEADETETLDADLVVDATGRTSRTPDWLASNGYEAPAVDEVAVDLSYSTAIIDRPSEDRRGFTVPPDPPRTHGCIMIPIEDERWTATAFGMHGDHPPTDVAGFKEFVADLPVGELGDLIANQEWVSDDVAVYPFPSNRRRRYENLDRFPDDLVVVGDAICSFNPIYGQGISVASLEARVLHDLLAEHGVGDRGSEPRIDGLGSAYFERTSGVIDVAWTLAVGTDFKFSQTTGPKPRGIDLLNRYVDSLIRGAQTDSALREAFYRVLMMESSPRSLLHPAIIWRVFGPT